MKTRILSLAILCWLIASNAFAATELLYTVDNQTTSTTAVVNVKNYRTKSIAVNGRLDAATFGNFSGTQAVKCGPTSSGPWVTCAQQDATAVSFTAPGVISWDDAFPYVQINIQALKHGVSVWLYGNQY